jgi:hypothetical protein
MQGIKKTKKTKGVGVGWMGGGMDFTRAVDHREKVHINFDNTCVLLQFVWFVHGEGTAHF